MRKLISASIILLMVLFTFSFKTTAQGFSSDVQRRLKKVIDSFQTNPANPFIGGMSVAIKVDGLALWQGSTGFAARNIDAQNNLLPGGTTFNIRTSSRIYSVTKTFTAALLLELANQRFFKLDDSIGKYLPLRSINPALNGKVTIRQLLAHESGYSDYVNEYELQLAVAAQPTHVWTPFEMMTFIHQIAPAGTERRYSSSNYVILGALIEAVTGKTMEYLYRKKYFEPLNLKSMYLDVREQIPGNRILAAPHDNISPFNPVFQLTGQPLFPDTVTNISRFPLTAITSLAFTGGAIVSDITDLTDFSSAFFNGRVTTKAVLNTMINSIASTPDPDGDYLGYGIFRSTKISEKDEFIGHDGNAPGYRSIMFFQPEKKLSLVILTNYHGANIYAIAKALYEIIPDFTSENKNDDNVTICFLNKSLCLPRTLASYFVTYGGATLGDCGRGSHLTYVNSNEQAASILQSSMEPDRLLSAFPNPFINTVSFSFNPAETGQVNMKLYDLNGKLLANIFNGFVQKGISQSVSFDGTKLPAGVYISRIQTSSVVIEKKIIKMH